MDNEFISKKTAMHSYVYWDGWFNDEELQEIINLCNRSELEDGKVLNKNIHNTDVRNSKINFHKPSDENFWIFNKLNSLIDMVNQKFYEFDLMGYEYFQYSVYDSKNKEHYDWHIDSSVNIVESRNGGFHRKLSLTLLLNDDFEGGEFQINTSQPEKIHCPKGRAILFPSFELHRVKPVTKGIRRSIVVWVLGPKWK
jgi:PKHD-type hydroxylase